MNRYCIALYSALSCVIFHQQFSHGCWTLGIICSCNLVRLTCLVRVRVTSQHIAPTHTPHPVLCLTPESPLPPYMVTARLNWGRCRVVCSLENHLSSRIHAPVIFFRYAVTLLVEISSQYCIALISIWFTPPPITSHISAHYWCSRIINTKYLLLTATDCVGFGLDRDIISLTLPRFR